MEKTIAFKISQRDYFKFNVIHNTKLTGYYGIIIFILTLLERDKTYSLPVGIIIALLFTTIFMIIIWVVTAIFLYFRSNSIYKQDKELSLPEELTFTEDYFEEKNERGYKQYYYTDIYKIKITKTLLIIYLAQVKAILIPASDEYDIQKLYLEIKETKALHTKKKIIGTKT